MPENNAYDLACSYVHTTLVERINTSTGFNFYNFFPVIEKEKLKITNPNKPEI